MTTITIDTRTVRLRLPVLRLGRLRGSLVLSVTEHVELRVADHHRARTSAGRSAAARARSARATAAAVDRAEAHRTAALAQRPPGF